MAHTSRYYPRHCPSTGSDSYAHDHRREGGIYKNMHDVDHVIPARYRDRVVVIRRRHRLPVSFTERRWEKHVELMHLGDLRTREVFLGERHPETDLRAAGESPSVRVLRLWRRVRGSAAAAPVPAEPAQP